MDGLNVNISKKHYIKIHFAVNVKSKEIVAIDITRDDIHDSKVFPKLLEESQMNGKVIRIYDDI